MLIAAPPTVYTSHMVIIIYAYVPLQFQHTESDPYLHVLAVRVIVSDSKTPLKVAWIIGIMRSPGFYCTQTQKCEYIGKNIYVIECPAEDG